MKLYHGKEWLFKEYYIKKKSMNQIAKEQKVSQQTINKFFHKFGFTVDTSVGYGWGRGLTKDTDKRIKKSSESSKGRIVWNKGIPRTEQSNKNSKYYSYPKGRKVPIDEIVRREETKRKIREANPNYGLNIKNNKMAGY